MQEHDDNSEDDYRGAAVVFTSDDEAHVEVVLRGYFEPIDGRFHWYGRIAANAEVDRLTGGRRKEVVLRTPQGEAAATLADPDPWNRYRVSGTGHPPFELETDLAELDAAEERGAPIG